MYKIGIVGLSGGGKSTFANFLANQLPCSQIISGDYYMKQAIEECSSSLTAQFGSLEYNLNGGVRLKNFIKDAETFCKTLKIIAPTVNDRMMQYINDLPDTTEYVIFDWAFMNMLTIWDDMQKKIIVSADNDTILKRLYVRDSPRDANGKERIKARVEYSKLLYTELDGIMILNNVNKEDLLEKAINLKQAIILKYR